MAAEEWEDPTETEEQEDAEGQEAEEELTPEEQALVDRAVARERATVEAQIRETLRSQGLDWTGDGAAIRDVNTFAAKFGFAGQQQQQAPPPPAPEPAADALGEMPDPSYDQAGFAAWLAKRDEINQSKIVKAFESQFQALTTRQAVSAVDVAVQRTHAILEEEGLNWAQIEGFDAAVRDTLLKQDMSVWDQPEFLLAAAGSVKRSLKAGPVAPRRETPRGEDGRYLAAEQQRRSLQQVGSPRDSGRPARGEAPPDEIERMQAQVAGMTLQEWRAYGPDMDYEAHKRFKEAEAARTRGRR